MQQPLHKPSSSPNSVIKPIYSTPAQLGADQAPQDTRHHGQLPLTPSDEKGGVAGGEHHDDKVERQSNSTVKTNAPFLYIFEDYQDEHDQKIAYKEPQSLQSIIHTLNSRKKRNPATAKESEAIPMRHKKSLVIAEKDVLDLIDNNQSSNLSDTEPVYAPNQDLASSVNKKNEMRRDMMSRYNDLRGMLDKMKSTLREAREETTAARKDDSNQQSPSPPREIVNSSVQFNSSMDESDDISDLESFDDFIDYRSKSRKLGDEWDKQQDVLDAGGSLHGSIFSQDFDEDYDEMERKFKGLTSSLFDECSSTGLSEGEDSLFGSLFMSDKEQQNSYQKDVRAAVVESDVVLEGLAAAELKDSLESPTYKLLSRIIARNRDSLNRSLEEKRKEFERVSIEETLDPELETIQSEDEETFSDCSSFEETAGERRRRHLTLSPRTREKMKKNLLEIFSSSTILSKVDPEDIKLPSMEETVEGTCSFETEEQIGTKKLQEQIYDNVNAYDTENKTYGYSWKRDENSKDQDKYHRDSLERRTLSHQKRRNMLKTELF